MKKMLVSIIFVVMITFVDTTVEANVQYCAGYLMGIIRARDDLTQPPFVGVAEAENILYLDTRWLIHNTGCWLEVQYREDRKTYVDGVLLTKEQKWTSGREIKTYYLLTGSTVENDKQFKKIADNVWMFDKFKLYLEAIPGYELKCLKTNKILRYDSDGWMISDRFQITKLIK